MQFAITPDEGTPFYLRLADAIERTRPLGDICVGTRERLRTPTLDRDGPPPRVDARARVATAAPPPLAHRHPTTHRTQHPPPTPPASPPSPSK